MSVLREARQEAYDAVVVGSGVGGLSTAAILAQAGWRVLVVERHDRPGGYAHSFKRRRYTFDSAVHLVAGCAPSGTPGGSIIDVLLRRLGVREQCTFLEADPFYGAVFPDLRLRVPSGREAFVDAHARHFSGEARAFGTLVDLCSKVAEELRRLTAAATAGETRILPSAVATAMRYRQATLAEVADAHLGDARLKTLFGAMWPYLGLPPSRVSFLYWCAALMSYVEEGAYSCQGSFQVMANALVTALEAHGGELLLRARVQRIMCHDGRVSGVILENGQRIAAPVVISNADAMQTFTELVGTEHLPADFVATLRRRRPSLSGVAVYLATDLDLRALDLPHETFCHASWDADETQRRIMAGRPDGLVISVPSLLDPSLAPPGEHVVSIITLTPYDAASSWRTDKPRFVEQVLTAAETVIPDLRRHITFVEGATPRTMERYTLNQSGALYGWEPSPDQIGGQRPNHRTPLSGLYLAGHWTQPGGGIYGVVASGLKTAQMLLGERTKFHGAA